MAADSHYRDAAEQREYERQYHEWFGRQTPEQQAKLKKMGMDKPLRDQCGGPRKSGDAEFDDPAERPEASQMADMGRRDSERNILHELLDAAVNRWGDLPRTLADFHAAVTQISLGVFDAAVEAGIIDVASMKPARGGLELLARVLADVIDAGHPGDRSRMEAEAIDFAIGLGVQMGMSETQIAEFHGVKKATISKRAVNAKKRYAMQPSRGMKGEKAVKTYAKMATGKKRALREPWIFAGLLKEALHG